MTCEVVLHVGAHRTGTTLFQHFLSANLDFLNGLGIDLMVPPATRSGILPDLEPQSGRLLISEENLLGNMEGNVAAATLYPNVSDGLLALTGLLPLCRCVMLSVRNPADYWPSAIAFSVSRSMDLPSDAQLQAIALSQRRWHHVIRDVQTCVPGAEIVVREFNWAIERPRQQLRQATHWDDVAAASVRTKVQNARPNVAEMAEALAGRGSEALHGLSDYAPFDAKTQRSLTKTYLEDLAMIRRMEGVKLLSDPLSALRQKWLGTSPP